MLYFILGVEPEKSIGLELLQQYLEMQTLTAGPDRSLPHDHPNRPLCQPQPTTPAFH